MLEKDLEQVQYAYTIGNANGKIFTITWAVLSFLGVYPKEIKI